MIIDERVAIRPDGAEGPAAEVTAAPESATASLSETGTATADRVCGGRPSFVRPGRSSPRSTQLVTQQ